MNSHQINISAAIIIPKMYENISFVAHPNQNLLSNHKKYKLILNSLYF